MRRLTRSAVGLAVVALTATSFGTVADAAPPPDSPAAPASSGAHRPDNRPGPLTRHQDALRKAAHQKLRAGEATENEDGVTEVDGKAVETSVVDTDLIFTVLAEFGDQGSGRLGTTPGPLHNEIQEPDRSADNSTIWIDDFAPTYYSDLFFGAEPSMKDFYETQSQGTYSLGGDVAGWVQVPGNASTYGDNAVEDYGGAWQFIEDTANAWYATQPDAATADAYLAQFDQWDRYDHDNDGDFNEPDGYLDHFQAVHAGEGEEGGGGAQGDDAIWSHRWYVNATDFGVTGPVVDGEQVKYGGTRIGESSYWIGDYTVEPENGGLGVFAHEYAHDLGLPDLYDTAGGDNSTAFWTLMSGGSWMGLAGDPTTDPEHYGLGDVPNHMGPWEKLQLGWLDYATVPMGSGETALTLGPASQQSDTAEQAVLVDVPDEGVTEDYTTPYSGATSWWSGSADDLNNTLETTLDLTGVSRATVTAKAWYDIEAGYDYLYAEYSENGVDWTQIGSPVDGSTNGRWATLRYTVPGGQAAPIGFRFRYQTDGGVHYAGAFLDDIKVTTGGTTLLFDDTESGEGAWTADGWKLSTGTETFLGDRYYLAEYRAYTDYDAVLGGEQGPYNFDKAYTAPNHVEHFDYQDGLLVWAVDEAYSDNSTSTHPGHGLALPVDARPVPILYSDGVMLGNRRQPFDATFGPQEPDATTFHREVLVGKGKNQTVETLTATPTETSALPTFTDAVEDAYYSADNPWASALVAGHGVTITVTSQGLTMGIAVVNPAAA
ncbi:MAG TPA: immune inhibitor A domain-containing protein [Acidimicrobiales bacterium]|nr:immune inhibitor A domain-containing protein [Acidimicrobiales bacterium]